MKLPCPIISVLWSPALAAMCSMSGLDDIRALSDGRLPLPPFCSLLPTLRTVRVEAGAVTLEWETVSRVAGPWTTCTAESSAPDWNRPKRPTPFPEDHLRHSGRQLPGQHRGRPEGSHGLHGKPLRRKPYGVQSQMSPPFHGRREAPPPTKPRRPSSIIQKRTTADWREHSDPASGVRAT